jgi:formate dehydrogenase subunit beta
MIDQVKEKISALLSDGSVKGVVAPALAHGHVVPHLFMQKDDLSALNLGEAEKDGDARYPLNKVLITLARKYPDETFGVLVRGCDERGLYGLYRLKQLDEQKVVPVGIACSKALATACECKKPFPDALVAGEKVDAPEAVQVKAAEQKNASERFAFWADQFLKCVKCYGCRDICPMCFCHVCSLECEDLVSKGDLPVDIPVFHLTRAMHMADRCVDCGLCDEACPSDIPLRLLYKKTAEIMNAEFGFTAGLVKDEKSPLSVMGPHEPKV